MFKYLNEVQFLNIFEREKLRSFHMIMSLQKCVSEPVQMIPVGYPKLVQQPYPYGLENKSLPVDRIVNQHYSCQNTYSTIQMGSYTPPFGGRDDGNDSLSLA